MKNRAGEYLGYNENGFRLGAFYGLSTGEQDRLPVWERVKRIAGWAGGAALTAPSEAPVHMSEHFRGHQTDQNLAA